MFLDINKTDVEVGDKDKGVRVVRGVDEGAGDHGGLAAALQQEAD